MKTNALRFLKAAFPFLATLFLWRLSGAVFNPGGILAVCAIFYCTFVRPVRWFAPFGVVMCFLIDYNFDSLLFWTALYCFCYALNGFQNVIDLGMRPRRALDAFSVFFGAAMTVMFFMRPGWHNLGAAVWTFAWTTLMYTPITWLIERVRND